MEIQQANKQINNRYDGREKKTKSHVYIYNTYATQYGKAKQYIA
jgi:hypothetical protein